MALTEPVPAYVRTVLDNKAQDEWYFGVDSAVRLVFNQWPRNTDPHEVLVKVVVLNRLYSTNVLDVQGLRDHILELKVDGRLDVGDQTVVNALADFRKGERPRWLMSFASKYCAWHRPDSFQMFDSFVERVLAEYNRSYSFASFRPVELRRDYRRFVEVVAQFRSHFHLDGFSRKEIDKFLWIEARKSARSSGTLPLR